MQIVVVCYPLGHCEENGRNGGKLKIVWLITIFRHGVVFAFFAVAAGLIVLSAHWTASALTIQCWKHKREALRFATEGNMLIYFIFPFQLITFAASSYFPTVMSMGGVVSSQKARVEGLAVFKRGYMSMFYHILG